MRKYGKNIGLIWLMYLKLKAGQSVAFFTYKPKRIEHTFKLVTGQDIELTATKSDSVYTAKLVDKVAEPQQI